MKKLKLSLRRYIILTFVALSIIPVALTSFITLNFFADQLADGIKSKNILVANMMAEEIENILNSPVSELNQLKAVTDIYELISKNNLNMYLHTIMRNYPYFESIQLLDSKGIIKYSIPYSAELLGRDISHEAYFKDAAKFSEPTWSHHTFMSLYTNQPTLVLAYPTDTGMIAANFNLEKLGELIEGIKAISTSAISILDENGTYIASQDKSKVLRRETDQNFSLYKSEAAFSGNPGKINIDGEEMLVSVARVKSTGWLIIISERADEAFSPVSRMILIFVLSVAFILLVALLISIKSIIKIYTPLSKLSATTNIIASGHYESELRLESFREFDSVAENFNVMVKNIKAREIDLIKTSEELMKKESELAFLNKNLEQRVLERTSQLEAANKDLESFSYSVSHDLKGPLREMDGFSRILEEDYANTLDKLGHRYLKNIRKGAKKMGHLIDDLLSFSKMSRADMNKSTIKMTELFKNVFNELTGLVPERNISLKIGSLPNAAGDKSLVRQVITNILSNAIKFTRSREAAVITVGSYPVETETVYYVNDNGVGFDMEFSEKLFGVFQRLHTYEEFEGNGVGLAIIQRIIYRHGGRVWIEGETDKGATFYFTLPGMGGPAD